MKLILSVAAICFTTIHIQPVLAQQAVRADTSAAAVMAKARLDAELAGSAEGGWFGRSVLVGAFTGYVGTGVMIAIATTSDPRVPAKHQLAIAPLSPAYQLAFQESYRETVKKKRQKTVVMGGLLGMVPFFALLTMMGG